MSSVAAEAAPSTAHADVLCMGHFCEKHGPSVVFVTESVGARVAAHVESYAETAQTHSPPTTSCAMCRSFIDGTKKNQKKIKKSQRTFDIDKNLLQRCRIDFTRSR